MDGVDLDPRAQVFLVRTFTSFSNETQASLSLQSIACAWTASPDVCGFATVATDRGEMGAEQGRDVTYLRQVQVKRRQAQQACQWKLTRLHRYCIIVGGEGRYSTPNKMQTNLKNTAMFVTIW